MTQDMNKQILRRDMGKYCFRRGRALLSLSFLLLMLCLGVTEAWGQFKEKPADLKAGGYSETWLRVMKTEALPSITTAKIYILFETTK